MLNGVTIGKCVGRGHYGAVDEGTWTGVKVALKMIPIEKAEELLHEAAVLKYAITIAFVMLSHKLNSDPYATPTSFSSLVFFFHTEATSW